jgi:hypothetical protein
VLLPLAVSTLGALPLIVLRERADADVVVRLGVALVLLVTAVVWWVRRRDEYRARLKGLLDAGRAARR